MACCKCTDVEFEWPDPQMPIYTDKQGDEYCVFHAPIDKKDISVEEFNQLIFDRINKSKKECILSNVVFPGDISFLEFSKGEIFPGLTLPGAIFHGEADFSRITFNEELFMVGAIFHKEANFFGSTFNSCAGFLDVKFKGESSFNGITFNDDCYYSESEFFGSSIFNFSKFNGPTSFNKTKFNEEVQYYRTEFRGDLDATMSQYRGEAKYEYAIFTCAALFNASSFYGAANFSASQFNSDVNFNEVEFYDVTLFRNCIFNKMAYFISATFNKLVDFSYAIANNNSLLLHQLTGNSLASINFIISSSYMFSFKSCQWPEKLYLENNEYKFQDCAELYRGLKQKAASEHDQPMVSKWHYREKLMALKQLKEKRGWWHIFSMTWLYHAFSGFGEKPGWAGAWLLGVVFGPLLFLIIRAFLQTGFSSSFDPEKTAEVFTYWLRCIPFIRQDASSMGIGGQLGAGLMQILIALQAALFGFALRNKFRR